MHTRRVSKLQEFVAHGSRVNCVHISRNTGSLVATGGDDTRVNLWALGKPHALVVRTPPSAAASGGAMPFPRVCHGAHIHLCVRHWSHASPGVPAHATQQSLGGHTSGVTCVALDGAEAALVAGSAGGTLKLWDVTRSSATRTLPGHKGAVQCVDFHPAGEFCASGAQDGTLRVWDARAARGCVATYRGHGTSPVCGLAFSPDGRWVVSGSQDGGVALWDVAGGKALCQLAPATGDAVTSIQFHPHQLLLSTCAADRSARVWCLETFRPVMDVTTQTAGPPRVCAFSPCGGALLLACTEGLLCCGWEPTTAFDDVAVPWKAVADAHCTGGRLLVASTHTSFVSVWVGDLARMAPWAAAVPGDSHGDGLAAAAASGSPAKDMSPLIKGAVAAPQPWRGSPCVTPTKGRSGAPHAAGAQRGRAPLAGESQSPGWSKPARGASALAATAGEHSAAGASPPATPPHRTSMVSLGNGVHRLSLAGTWALSHSELRAAMAGAPPGQQGGGAAPARQQPNSTDHPPAPPPPAQSARPGQPRPPALDSELGAVSDAIGEHSRVAAALALRHSHVTALRNALARGDPHGCAALLARAATDPVAVADALAAGPGSLLTLDGCAAVVPHLRPLLAAAPGVEVCEAHVAIGMATLEAYTKAFSAVIRDAAAADRHADGRAVDLQAAERRERCTSAAAAFGAVLPAVQALASRRGPCMARAKELAAAIEALVPT